MAKRHRTVFAEHDGRLYVQVRAVMSPLIPFIDGLKVVSFKGDKHLYLPIDVAIDWCREEMRHHSKEKFEVMISVMEKAKAQETRHGEG